MGFRRDIDGLRAVAVVLVVANHLFGTPAGGFVGVDVFFVISGYLITGLLLERSPTGRITFREFYARRVRRIVPAALLVLAVTSIAGRLIWVGPRATSTVTDALWAAGFLANVHFAAAGASYAAANAAPSAVQHFWSLGVEEQFYLVWPALLAAVTVLAARLRRHRTQTAVLTGVLLIGCMASFVWAMHETATASVAGYFSPVARAWELGAGALLAVHAARVRMMPAGLRAGVAWIGLVAVVASAFVNSRPLSLPGSAATLPVIGAVLLLLGGDAPRSPGTAWLLGSGPARYVGRVSYSLYLWHWPVIVFAASLWGLQSPAVRLGAATSVLMLAAASYHLVENPIRHSRWLSGREVKARRSREIPRGRSSEGRRGWRPREELQAAAALAVTALGVSLLLPATSTAAPPVRTADTVAATPGNSLEQVLAARIARAVVATTWPALRPALPSKPETLAPPELFVDKCLDVNPGTAAHCHFGLPNAPRRAVVIGDSMATSYMPAIVGALAPQGWDVQVLTMSACTNAAEIWLNVPSNPYVGCEQHRAWALGVAASSHADLVVFTDWFKGIAQVVGQRTLAGAAGVWSHGLAANIRRMQATGARVVVLAPPPGSGNLSTCRTRFSAPARCLATVPALWRTEAAAERAAAAMTGATYVDTLSWFCSRGSCPAFVGRTPVYWDGQHLTDAYARQLIPLVASTLAWPATAHNRTVNAGRRTR